MLLTIFQTRCKSIFTSGPSNEIKKMSGNNKRITKSVYFWNAYKGYLSTLFAHWERIEKRIA